MLLLNINYKQKFKLFMLFKILLINLNIHQVC